jgi:hypothetical protein
MRIQLVHRQYTHQPMKITEMQLCYKSHRAQVILHENSDYPNHEFSKSLMTINYSHTTTHRTHTCFQMIIPFGYNFANGYGSNILYTSSLYRTFCKHMKYVLCMVVCSTSTTVTSGQRIILTVSTHMSIKSISVSAFGLKLSRILSRILICYLRG